MLCEHLRQNKAPVLDAMKRIADVLCHLGRSYIEAGMDGVFYASLGGEKHFFTDEEFDEYIRPFDIQIMQAIKAPAATQFCISARKISIWSGMPAIQTYLMQ